MLDTILAFPHLSYICDPRTQRYDIMAGSNDHLSERLKLNDNSTSSVSNG